MPGCHQATAKSQSKHMAVTAEFVVVNARTNAVSRIVCALQLSVFVALSFFTSCGHAQEYDVVLRNGRVCDGSGGPCMAGGIAINGDKIAGNRTRIHQYDELGVGTLRGWALTKRHTAGRDARNLRRRGIYGTPQPHDAGRVREAGGRYSLCRNMAHISGGLEHACAPQHLHQYSLVRRCFGASTSVASVFRSSGRSFCVADSKAE